MSNLRKKLSILLTIALVFTLLTPALASADSHAEEVVKRIAGADRFATSAEIALDAYGKADTVIVVNGEDKFGFADGLTASVLASALDAPILLTAADKLPGSVADVIEELGATTAYILGGTTAVSKAVEDELAKLVDDVERLSGSTRYETAVEIAKAAGTESDVAYIVNGFANADAMVAGAAAFAYGQPILLVEHDEVPEVTAQALAELGIKEVVIVGGEAVVSAKVVEALEGDYDVVRLSGAGRYGTSAAFAEAVFDEVEAVGVVNGWRLADAVGASVYGNPILYANADGKGLDEPVEAYIDALLEENHNLKIQIFGGTQVVSADLAAKLQEKVEAAIPQELAVESVSAINSYTVEVEFNSALPEHATNIEHEHFVIGEEAASAVALSEDGKVATIEFDTRFPSGEELELVVQNFENLPEEGLTATFTYFFEVESVKGITTEVDKNTDGQYTEFTVNGESRAAEISYLNAAGYDVEFLATKNVYVGSEDSVEPDSKSSTGELDKNGLENVDNFEYKVVVTKDELTIESELVEVTVSNYSQIVTAITSYDLLFNDDVVNESGVLSLSDTGVKIANVKGNLKDGSEGADITESVTFSSTNETVALIDNNGGITPVSAGQTTFVIKSGDVQLEVPVTVSAEDRVPTQLTTNKAEIKLITGATDSFNVEVRDQFGDPVKGFDPSIDVVTNANEEEILTATFNATNNEGKGSIVVTANATNSGQGTLEVKNDNDEVLLSLPVAVSNDTTPAYRQLELVEGPENFVLDLNPLKDESTLTLVLNEYNADGYLIGGYNFYADDSVLIVESSDDSIITVEIITDEDGASNGQIEVTASAVGTAKVLVKEGSVVRYSQDIEVVDTTPSITSFTFKAGLKIIEGTLGLGDIVDSVELSSDASVAYDVDENGDVVIYVAVDEGEDILLGKIEAVSNDFTTAQFMVTAENGIQLVKNIVDDNVEEFDAEDEGSIVLKVTVPGETNPIATALVEVVNQ